MFPKTYQATASAAALDSARAELAALILHALGKGAENACGTTACSSDPVVTTLDANSNSGGCSTTGMQSLWLAVPVLALFVFRRRRTA